MPGPAHRPQLTPEVLDLLRSECEAARVAFDDAAPHEKHALADRLYRAVRRLTDAVLEGKAPSEP